MKKVDFIFTYEHKTREIDNICLLSLELEKRGYSTEIINLYDVIRLRDKTYEAVVGVIPAAYDDKSLFYSFAAGIVPKKVVNLQWEQVFSVHQTKSLQSRRNISGKAKSAVHLSWGENNRKRLVDVCEIEPNKVKITGHVAMDFLRDEFREFYNSRDELFQKYGIDTSKKVCLFISSFTSTGALKHEIDKAADTLGKKVYDRRIVSIESQKIILKWFNDYFTNHPDTVLIYRPHPAERDNEMIMEMEENLPNFHVIRDYSVKQWLLTVDQVFTWSSTSIIEAYFANVNCQVLRPIEMDNDLDMVIYEGGKFISTYEEFANSIEDPDIEFPIKEDKIFSNYYVDPEEPTYVKIANILEEVYHNPAYNLTDEEIANIPNTVVLENESLSMRKIKNFIKKTPIYHLYYKFMLNDKEYSFLPKKLKELRKLYKLYDKDNKRKNATPEEIKHIKDKLLQLEIFK